MKRILSAVLVIVMLVTAMVVPTAALTYSNTIDMCDQSAETLYAKYGTASIDGVKESKWDDAYTIRLDAAQKAITGGDYPNTLMANIYYMWDATNLYILEERFNDDITYRAAPKDNWTAPHGDCTAYYIMPPQNYTGVKKQNGAVNMIFAQAGNATQQGTAVDSVVFGRAKYYTTNTYEDAKNGENNTTDGWDYSYNSGTTRYDAVTSKTMLTENGFLMETAIPWSILGLYNTNGEYTPQAGNTLGIAIIINDGTAKGTHKSGIRDWCGFQKMQLLGDKAANPTPIIPDTSWYKSTGDLHISNAADLLGLVDMTHNYAKYSKYEFANAYSVTSGRTIYLDADIDLNPGTFFNADGSYTGNAPVNVWKGIASFAGTFDGQGHTIKGMYAPNGLSSGPYADEFGFVGRLITGSTIKNLNLTNGYLCGDSWIKTTYTDKNQNGTQDSDEPDVYEEKGDNIGSFVGVVHCGGIGTGTITIEGCYSDLHIAANTKAGDGYIGGIYGTAYTSATGTISITVSNTSFVGTLKQNVRAGNAGQLAGRAGWVSGSNIMNATYTDCYYPSTGKVYATTGGGTVTNNPAKVFIQETEVENNTFSVRILSGLSNLHWDNVGFRVIVSRADGTTVSKVYTTTKVFKSIQAAGKTVLASELDADYQYLYGLTIENVPADESLTFAVMPYRTTGGHAANASLVSHEMYDDGVAVDDWTSYIPQYSASASQSYAVDANCTMKEYSNVSKANFTAFINQLKANGFAISQENTLGENSYALASNGIVNAYVSHIESQDVLRLYTEPALRANPSDAEPAGGTYTPKMWQLRVDNINSRLNGGMSYVFLLSDGTFFIIDGGYNTAGEADNLYQFLKNNTPAGKETVISGWYFSHTHGDHIGAIQAFAPRYASEIDVKAFYYHFENDSADVQAFNGAAAYWPDAVHYSRIHTGMKINLPGIDVNVIYTLEDLYKTGFSFTNLNGNNYSAVIRVDVTANGKTQKIMFLGDIQVIATQCIKSMYASNSDALKADFVQFSHHGYEGADRELYDRIAAPTVLWPINVVSTQESYGSVCNVFTRWGMGTKDSKQTETNPVTGASVSYNFPNDYIWSNATYVKKIVLAGESAAQEFAFPYTPSGSKKPDVEAIYNRDHTNLVPDKSLFPF